MTTFGKYQVIDLVGEGGFGKVYRGQDPILKRPVAIKTCTLREGDMRERFAREAEIAANLRHPNILTVYDFGEENGEPYLVQEFLPGEDMDVKIRRADLIPLNTKIDWLRQVANGLRFAHEHGVVHRDVKPSNIRILPDGQVRIMDFGIAKLLQSDRQITQMGFSVGTTGYLAPEQLRGEELDHRADIFSFGVLAYELITYRRPFEGETVTAILYRIANVDPAPLAEIAPSCPPRLAHCVERCLRKSPDDRWASLALVVDELDAVAREIGAIGDAAIAVGPTRAFEVVTGSGPTRATNAERPAEPAAEKRSPEQNPRPAPAKEPAAAGGRRFRPVLVAFVLITLVLGVFGIVNVIRWASPGPVSAEADRTEDAAFDDAADLSPGAVDAAERGPSRDTTADPSGASSVVAGGIPQTPPGAANDGAAGAGAGGGGAADRIDATGTSERAAGQLTDTAGMAAASTGGGVADPVRRGGQRRGGAADRSGAAARGAEQGTPPRTERATALPAASILVLIGGGPEPARGIAESSLLAELLDAGFSPVQDRTSVDMEQRIAEIRGLAEQHQTGTVLVGRLDASAAPGVGRFFTGSATLDLRAYDVNDARLLGARSFQVGAGGVPGKSAASEAAAIADAARAVAYQASRYVATLVTRD